MTKYIDVSGKTEDEAIASGLAQLNLTRDDVSVEILERAKSGFLGIGSCPAKVRLTYEVPDVAPVEPPKQPKAEQSAKAEAPKPRPERPAKPKQQPKQNRQPKAEQPIRPVQAEPPKQPKSAAAEGSQRERVETYLHGLLDLMGVEAELKITERENGGLNVELCGDSMGAVIGRRGETLDAIQHLVN